MIFILLNLVIITSNTLLFYFQKSENQVNDFIEDLLYSSIYTNVSIGNPEQIIEMNIKLENYQTFISGSNIENHNYNEKKSKSFQNTSEKFEDSSRENLEEGFICYETFTFTNYKNKKNKYEKFPFALTTKINNLKELNILGLNLYDTNLSNIPNFLKSLKSNNIIEERIFYFEINKDNLNIGKLTIGNYPHEIEPNNYNIKNLLNLNPKFSSFTFEWDIRLDKIYSGNEKFISGSNDAKLRIELGVFVGSFYYEDFIYRNFFDKLIQNKKCGIFSVKNKYKYYSCDNDIQINNFPDLYFYNKDNNFSFVFNYEDLFYKNKNKIYFLVVFKEKETHYWVLGRPFFKKYKLIFNSERRIISFYSIYGNDSYKPNIWINLLLFLLFLIIIILVIYLIYYLKNKPKKLYAKELTEELNIQIF